MPSLVLLKREQPQGIYVTEGESGSEVLSRLGYAKDPNVQALAELPGLSPDQLCCILDSRTSVPKWRARVAKWYDYGPGAVFTALASLFEKKPTIRLWKADRELIHQMRIEAMGLAKETRAARELPLADRHRIDDLIEGYKLVWRSENSHCENDSRRLDAIVDNYKTAAQLANDHYESIRCEMQNVRKQLQALTKLTKTCARQEGRETPQLAATSSLFAAEPNQRTKRDEQQVMDEQPPAEANEPVYVAIAGASEELAEALIGEFATQASVIEGNKTAESLEGQQQPPTEPWAPNARFESMCEDLSDLSSIDGHESPRHKQVKVFANARREAKTGLEPTSVPSVSNEVTLATCSREDAQTAASVRQQLQKTFGNEGATRLLAPYQSKIMRDRFGRPQRFLVDSAGALVGLVFQKKVAPE